MDKLIKGKRYTGVKTSTLHRERVDNVIEFVAAEESVEQNFIGGSIPQVRVFVERPGYIGSKPLLLISGSIQEVD
jgi:hypothetical protein